MRKAQMRKAHITINPEIGMGVTKCVGSDRYPYSVVLIVSPKKIVVRSDQYRRVDQNGFSEQQEYEYTPNPTGIEKTLTLRSNGRWCEEGEKSQYSFWSLGVRRAYTDPSF